MATRCLARLGLGQLALSLSRVCLRTHSRHLERGRRQNPKAIVSLFPYYLFSLFALRSRIPRLACCRARGVNIGRGVSEELGKQPYTHIQTHTQRVVQHNTLRARRASRRLASKAWKVDEEELREIEEATCWSYLRLSLLLRLLPFLLVFFGPVCMRWWSG